MPLLTAEQVAARLAVSRRVVEEMARRGEGPPSLKLGRYRRWDERDVEAYVDAQRAAAARASRDPLVTTTNRTRRP